MTRWHTLQEAQEQAALYLAGALPEEEARAFQAHLLDGCELCQGEMEGMGQVGQLLAESSPPRRPCPGLRDSVLEHVARIAGSPFFEKDGLSFVRSEQVDWQDLGDSGIKIKTLGVDARRSYRSLMVRMVPGAVYPDHRHADVEELYLLDGDLTVSGVLMRAGDYCRAETGSLHKGISTRGGCVFVTFASLNDQLIEEQPPPT